MGQLDKLAKASVLKSWYHSNYSWMMRSYYGKRRRMGMPTLKTVHWVTTFKCNFACKGCEASAGQADDAELTTREALSLVRELSSMGVRTIWMGGGEPLMRKDLFEVIGAANQLGLEVAIGTNGYLVRAFAQEFRKHRLAWMFTSIDGLEKNSDAYRGMPGAFRRSLDALDFFAEIGVPQRIVMTVVHPGNIHELPELRETIAASNATEWRITPCKPVGRAETMDDLMLSSDQIADLMAFVARERQRMPVAFAETSGYLGKIDAATRYAPFLCTAGIKTCVVLPEGSVVGCAPPYTNRHAEGNIRTTPLAEIWRNGFQKYRNPTLPEKCVKCKYEKSCHGGCWPVRQEEPTCFRHIWGDAEEGGL